MDTKAQSAKAPVVEGDRNHPEDFEAPHGAEEWTDDPAILDAWMSSLISVRGRSQATAKRYRRLVERLLEDVGKPIAQLDQKLIERHVRRLHVAGRGESVRRGVVVAIRSLGEWCLAHGILAANPGSSLSGPRPYRREIKVLTIAEVGRLLWGGSPGTLPHDPLEMRNRVLLGVSYMAGLRASEIGPLEAEGVVWHETGQIFSILVRRGKGSGQDIRLPLDRPVSRMLGVWLAVRGSGNGGGRFLWGRPLTRGAVRNIFLDRCAEVGIEATGRRLSPHILRHSLATHLLQEGVDIRQVQLLLRHRSIATTELYLHADVDRLGSVLIRKSPLERGRRKKVAPLRPALEQLLGELQGLGRPT
jgi:site-specific recombinase XerC